MRLSGVAAFDALFGEVTEITAPPASIGQPLPDVPEQAIFGFLLDPLLRQRVSILQQCRHAVAYANTMTEVAESDVGGLAIVDPRACTPVSPRDANAAAHQVRAGPGPSALTCETSVDVQGIDLCM